MRVLLSPFVTAVLVSSCTAVLAQPREPIPPAYAADTILNAASGMPDGFAPYTQISIHGSNLAFQNVTVDLEKVTSLPITLGNATTKVSIRNFALGILSVTPDEIVAVIPPDMLPGSGFLQVLVNAKVGPSVPITIRRTAPAVFLREEGLAAVLKDDVQVTRDEPASPGDIVTIFTTGMGPTRPAPDGFTILRRLALSSVPVRVSLDFAELDGLEYAGLQTGVPGLYQVRLRLPDGVGPDPEVRVLVEGASSQDGVRIPVRVAPPPARIP